MLIDGVGAATLSAQPIERGNAERCGEAAVTATARAAFAQIEAELRSDGARALVQRNHGSGALERRPPLRFLQLQARARLSSAEGF